MAETLEEQYEREKPRVDAELRRRSLLPAHKTGICLKAGKSYIDGNGAVQGPMEESPPGVWRCQRPGGDMGFYYQNGIQWNHTPDSLGNLKTEAP